MPRPQADVKRNVYVISKQHVVPGAIVYAETYGIPIVPKPGMMFKPDVKQQPTGISAAGDT